MQLAQLIEGLQIKDVRGTLAGDIKHISHNSKKIGCDGLFVALKGSRTNGHDYIPEAIAAGATALIVEEDRPVDSVNRCNGFESDLRLAAQSEWRRRRHRDFISYQHFGCPRTCPGNGRWSLT